MRLVFAASLLACSAPKAEDPHAHHHMVGSGSTDPARGAHLAITCDAAAQTDFDHGYFFLHNMDYVSARRTYEEAATKYPSCAMIHWGVAMTYFQPLWPGQPTADTLAKGSAAIARARAAASGSSALERDLIEAAAAYYEDSPDTQTRYKRWEAGQHAVVEHHPDDIEAKAFWAVSRLATVDKKDKTYKEALEVAAMLEELLKQRPEHPGLLHYLLHAYDNPTYASRAVAVTNTYATVSPDAAHALHMPSHIHVRLGNWQQVVDWNIKSAAAALKHPVDGRVSRDWLHASDYLIYGYLQQGDDAKAKEALGKIDPKTSYELNSGPGAYGLAASPARFALERGAWKEAAELVARNASYNWDQYPWAEAVTYAAKGLGAARLGDVAAAENAIKELERIAPKIESPWWKGRVEIERDVIAAWIAHAKSDDKTAETLLASAATRELAAGKDSVEPGHVVTAAEQLGDFYMETKQPAKALDAYKKALAESPKRFHALAAAGRAAELQGLPDEAKRFYMELVESTSKSSSRPERAAAQRFLAR